MRLFVLMRNPAIKTARLGGCLFIFLLLAGCQPLEQTVQDALALHAGFIDKAEQNHPECLLQGDANPICAAIKRSGFAHNVVIDVLHVYCSGAPKAGSKAYGPDPVAQGGPCSPQKGLEGRLRAAFQDFDRNFRDLQAVLEGKK